MMNTTHPASELLTIAETADYLRVSQRTVFNYIKQGYITPVRIGGTKKTGRVLVPRKELSKLIARSGEE
ncbi:helix-turn-helix domain-containing protein [Patescibacteria group bacterium]|nr:helix-turn-helix domain-containing protein [Patescibacteria group bacterium]